MRSLYLEDISLDVGKIITIEDDDFHHLSIVCRSKVRDEVLLLNGTGRGYLSNILEIKKKSLRLEITNASEGKIKPQHSVMILIPKKDALDLMVKSCVELGIKEIILCRGDYSSEKIPEMTKLKKILKQAIEQSNSFYGHEIKVSTLAEFDFSTYDSVNILDIEPIKVFERRTCSQDELVVVGPEGGFSSQERIFLNSLPKSQVISLRGNILRAPTALIAGLGWLYGNK